MNSEIKEKVLRVVQRVTGRPVEEINLEGDLKKQLSIDSVQLVELFAVLETELGVELPLRLMTVKTGSEFMTILEEELLK
jgi:acyl carrier protein